MVKTLEKRKLGNTGEQVTFIGFGALEIGRDWGLGEGKERERPSDEAAGEVLNGVLDLGINIIDTASAYHRSEVRLGTYLASRRQEYFLASKCGEHNDEPKTYYDFSYQAVKRSIDESLVKLKTDCIDLMQIHFGPNPQKVLDDGETVAAMKAAKAEGKIRLLGASTSDKIALQCIESKDFDVMQLDYSLLNRRDEHLVNLCGKKGIGVILRGGLAYGRLTPRVVPHLENDRQKEQIRALIALLNGEADKLPALALQFLRRNPSVSSVLAGTKNLLHVKHNLALMEVVIDETTMQKAMAISAGT
jgi:aryl-alcohol dehydrogenase-like predicted oxidoreductase